MKEPHQHIDDRGRSPHRRQGVGIDKISYHIGIHCIVTAAGKNSLSKEGIRKPENRLKDTAVNHIRISALQDTTPFPIIGDRPLPVTWNIRPLKREAVHTEAAFSIIHDFRGFFSICFLFNSFLLLYLFFISSVSYPLFHTSCFHTLCFIPSVLYLLFYSCCCHISTASPFLRLLFRLSLHPLLHLTPSPTPSLCPISYSISYSITLPRPYSAASASLRSF